MEHGIAMEPMKGKLDSSGVDLGYTELFCILEVTAVFFSFCDSVLGNSLVFHQANRGALLVSLGTWDCSAHNGGESSLISQQGVCLMGFLELRQEPRVYFRFIAGMVIRNSTFFSEVWTPVLL